MSAIQVPIYGQGDVVVAFATFDLDRPDAWRRRFHLSNGYAMTHFKGKKLRAHRIVAGLKASLGFEVHHLNHDRLDNRAANLALVTPKRHYGLHRTDGVAAPLTVSQMSDQRCLFDEYETDVWH